MFSPIDAQCLSILQTAADAPIGIVVRTTNPAKARQALYRVRKDFGTLAMEALQIRASADDPNEEIWIFQRNIANATTVSFAEDAL